MHGHARDVLTTQLTFAGVHSDAHLQTEPAHAAGDGCSTLHCSARTVERGQEPVTGVLYLPPAKSPQLTPDELIVALQRASPIVVAQSGSAGGGIHDVGEQD